MTIISIFIMTIKKLALTSYFYGVSAIVNFIYNGDALGVFKAPQFDLAIADTYCESRHKGYLSSAALTASTKASNSNGLLI